MCGTPQATLRRVVPPPAPGVTAADPLNRAPPAAPRAVKGDGIDRILTARRMKAALSAEQPAERDAIQEDEVDEEPTHAA
jgi:hypothetical protein